MKKRKKAPTGRAVNWMRRRGLMKLKYRSRHKEEEMRSEANVLTLSRLAPAVPVGDEIKLVDLERQAANLREQLAVVERRIAFRKRIINGEK